MSDVPVQIIVAVFPTEQGADSILYELEAARLAGYVGIHHVAVLRRDAENKLHIRETDKSKVKKGAAWGGAIGAVVGLVAGPGAVVVSGAGAIIGGLAAKLLDSGFDDRRLKELSESLQPGTSALVVVVEHKWAADVEKQLSDGATTVVTEELAADMAQRLVVDGEVTYTAVGADESIIPEQ